MSAYKKLPRVKRRKNATTGPTWWAEWCVLDAAGKRTHKSVSLGLCSEVSQPAAIRLLRDHISDDNRVTETRDWRAVAARKMTDSTEKPQARDEPLGKTKKTAWFAELTVAADLLSKNFDVYRPLHPYSACDLVYADDGKFVRVEVKFVRTGEERALGKNLRHNAGKFDLLAIVNEVGKIEYATSEQAAERFMVPPGVRYYKNRVPPKPAQTEKRCQ